MFHYSPSVLTARFNLSRVFFPLCQDPLVLRDGNKAECMFSPRRIAKVANYKEQMLPISIHLCNWFQVVWKPIQTKAADLYSFIENFHFDQREYMRLLQMFNEEKNIGVLPAGEKGPRPDLLERVACDWLTHKCKKHGLDHLSLNQSAPKQPWHQNFPVTQENHLYIGRLNIFVIMPFYKM